MQLFPNKNMFKSTSDPDAQMPRPRTSLCWKKNLTGRGSA